MQYQTSKKKGEFARGTKKSSTTLDDLALDMNSTVIAKEQRAFIDPTQKSKETVDAFLPQNILINGDKIKVPAARFMSRRKSRQGTHRKNASMVD